jgi:hypothetical protein
VAICRLRGDARRCDHLPDFACDERWISLTLRFSELFWAQLLLEPLQQFWLPANETAEALCVLLLAASLAKATC